MNVRLEREHASASSSLEEKESRQREDMMDNLFRSSLPPSSRSAYIPTSVKAVLSRALKVSLVSKIVVLLSISDSDVLIRIIFAGGHQER